MESKSFEKSADVPPISVYLTPVGDRNDEVSLLALWQIILRRKRIVLLSLLAALLLAITYVMTLRPLYRADAYLLPPPQQNIQGLMIDYGGGNSLEIRRYTPDLVYKAFLTNLKSKGVRREFFDTHDLAGHYLIGEPYTDADIDRAFDVAFSENLEVRLDKQDISFVTVSFTDQDPTLAAEWLNELIVFVNQRTVDQLFEEVNAAIREQIEQVRYQLASKLKLAAQRRNDRILDLQEALRVAIALGIENTGGLTPTIAKETTSIGVNTAEIPLYMRGKKALEAEIAVLESRKSDEPFIVGLRDLQEKQALLEGITIDRDKLSAITIDVAARTPYRSEKPRKTLIVILATLSGLMVGIFLVFIAEFWSKVRSQSESPST